MSIPMLEFPKAPAAIVPCFIDWSNELAGDTIEESIWVVAAGITKVSDAFSDTLATIWLSGGQHGQEYQVTNRITSAAGLVDDQSFILEVRQT